MTERGSDGAQVDPILRQAMEDAVRSQLSSLRAELAEYEALRAGDRRVLELISFDELPRALVQARIAAGLSQKQLAERLGLKEQQIQRYEASEYASASLQRLKAVIEALGVRVIDVRLTMAPADEQPISSSPS
jgi:ribosome-binding protein aMBF1 (putative translation factor)